MCGRYVSASSPQAIADYFGATVVEESLVEPNYNVAPTADVPVVREWSGDRRVDLFRWGLVPTWAKSASIGNKMINARIETITDKSAFRAAARRRRCIVPADAFYEWTAVPDPGAKKPIKQPWCIRRADNDPFAFAGLYEIWRDPERDGERLFSFTILTTDANEAMQRIHDRMPVVLSPQRWTSWLDPANEDIETLLAGLEPVPSELLAIHAVSTAVNNSRSTGAELMEPVEPITEASLAAAATSDSRAEPVQETLL